MNDTEKIRCVDSVGIHSHELLEQAQQARVLAKLEQMPRRGRDVAELQEDAVAWRILAVRSVQDGVRHL